MPTTQDFLYYYCVDRNADGKYYYKDWAVNTVKTTLSDTGDIQYSGLAEGFVAYGSALNWTAYTGGRVYLQGVSSQGYPVVAVDTNSLFLLADRDDLGDDALIVNPFSYMLAPPTARSTMDYDVLIAVTEQTMSAQIARLGQQLQGQPDKFPDTVPAQTPGLDGKQIYIDPPSISFRAPSANNAPTGSCPTDINLMIPVYDGNGYSIEFQDMNDGSPVDIAGFTFQFPTTMQADIVQNDFSNVSLLNATRDHLSGYMNNDWDVRVLRPDLQKIQVSDCVVLNAAGEVQEGLDDIAQAVAAYFNSDAFAYSPYSANVMTIRRDQDDPARPSDFTTTAAQFSATTQADHGVYNSLNTLAMTNGRALPNSGSTSLAPVVSPPPCPVPASSNEAAVQGRLKIFRETFNQTYVRGKVVPALIEAIGGPQNAWANYMPGGWQIVYQIDDHNVDNNDGRSEGHGPKIGDSGAHAIYGVTTTNNTLVIPDLDSAGLATFDDKIVLNGTGTFSQSLVTYKNRQLNVWEATSQTSAYQNFTFDITLSIDPNGAITVATKTTAQDVVPFQDENWDAVADDIFTINNHDTVGGVSDAAATSMSSFVGSNFDAFTSDAEADFAAMQSTVLLPDGTLYNFKNMTLDADKNIQIDLSVNY